MGLYQVNKNRKLFVLIFLVLILGALWIWISWKDKPSEKRNLRIRSAVITVEIAETPWAQYQGLSNRASICANCGMLFIYSDRQIREFVMRNMKFPLDIIYISNGEIIKIDFNLTPEGSWPQKLYNSGSAADKVLEVRAGFCENNGIRVGDSVFNN